MGTARADRLYDEDFFAWTRLQARELRRFARTRPNLPLDLAHIAGEIADLGTEQRNALRSWTLLGDPSIGLEEGGNRLAFIIRSHQMIETAAFGKPQAPPLDVPPKLLQCRTMAIEDKRLIELALLRQ